MSKKKIALPPIASALQQAENTYRSLIPSTHPHKSTLEVLAQITFLYEAIISQGKANSRNHIASQALAALLLQSFGNAVQNLVQHLKDPLILQMLGGEGGAFYQCLHNTAAQKHSPHTTWTGADRNSFAHLTSLITLCINLQNIETCFGSEFQALGMAAKANFEQITGKKANPLQIDWAAESLPTLDIDACIDIHTDAWRRAHSNDPNLLPYSYLHDIRQTLALLHILPKSPNSYAHALDVLSLQMLGKQHQQLLAAGNMDFVGQIQTSAHMLKEIRNDLAHTKKMMHHLANPYDQAVLKGLSREDIVTGITQSVTQWSAHKSAAPTFTDMMPETFDYEENSKQEPEQDSDQELDENLSTSSKPLPKKKKKKKEEPEILPAPTQSILLPWDQKIQKMTSQLDGPIAACLKTLGPIMRKAVPTPQDFITIEKWIDQLPAHVINRVLHLERVHHKTSKRKDIILSAYRIPLSDGAIEIPIENATLTPQNLYTTLGVMIACMEHAPLRLLVKMAEKGLDRALYSRDHSGKKAECLLETFGNTLLTQAPTPDPTILAICSKLFLLYRHQKWAMEGLSARDSNELFHHIATALLQYDGSLWSRALELGDDVALDKLCGLAAIAPMAAPLHLHVWYKAVAKKDASALEFLFGAGAASIKEPPIIPPTFFTLTNLSMATLITIEAAYADSLNASGKRDFSPMTWGRALATAQKIDLSAYHDIIAKELYTLESYISEDPNLNCVQRKICIDFLIAAQEQIESGWQAPRDIPPSPQPTHVGSTLKNNQALVQKE